MNTGVQRSGATPPAARTATTQPVGDEPGQRVRPGQERAADRDGARDPVRRDGDGRRPARHRVQGRARDGDPRRALPARARDLPARLGLRVGATRSRSRGWRRRPGCSRSSRPRTARSPTSSKIRHRCRSRSTSSSSAATRTCSVPSPAPTSSSACRIAPTATSPLRPARRGHCGRGRGDDGAGGARIGRESEEETNASRLLRSAMMEKPFAITLDVGSSLANKTGRWRTERPGHVHRMPPCNNACPAGENIQALALPAPRRATTRAHGGS